MNEITVTVTLPAATVTWLDRFCRFTGDSNAQNSADQIAEVVRMQERADKARTGDWDEGQEADYLAFQKKIGNG